MSKSFEEKIHEIAEAVYEPTEQDVVNEPSHYRQGTFETIDEMIIVFGPQKAYDFCVMNAWKYRSRAPFKGHLDQDMAKANRYLEMAKYISDKNKNWMLDINLIME